MTTTATPTETDQDRKVVITLTAGPAAFTRRLSKKMGVSIPEVVRRALGVLDLITSLDPENDELIIRHKDTKESERVVFHWGID